jgi:AraC-like DNA-binding protein
MNLVAVAADLEAAQDILSDAYGPVRIDARGPRRGLRLERAALGSVQFHHVNVAMHFDAVGGPRETLVFGELTSGRVRQSSGGSDRHYVPGKTFLAAQPGLSYTATVHEADMRLAVIDPALLSQVADTAPGRAQVPVQFTGYEAVSAQASDRWTDACAYLRENLLADPGASTRPLVAASAARLLVATALATFPNNALTDPTVDDRHDGSPATLRRAVAFIDEHAHQDIAVADVAAATHVTIRAVQLAFRRHLDTTPTRYLRRVRLDHAHRQLVTADPERESVTAVAYRWGFTSSSRFAAYYRTAYGVSPSTTLRAS